ncbi:cytochrome P450 [Cytobacillus horneckiae]|uniref:cytochrome P450 n=1 Tax=Cytobacillus horneckiae TaxID=549687 RepID=UPI0019D1A43F|nr:cytochrome P450 [Cytobacillus horneckiae]MBN6889314.1 cytochrome P450 [Cytobacillus horneckiae]
MKLTKPTDSSSININEFDLSNPHLHSEGDVHLIWHAMRERAPVHWQDVGNGLGFWSVTKHNDVVKVLSDHTLFTSERGTLLNLLGIDDPAGGRQMTATDPPRHTQMRRPIQQGFTQRSLKKHSDVIRKEIRKLLVPAADGEVIDFASAMMSLSTAVAGTILGLPESDWPKLTHLTAMAIAPDDTKYLLPQGTKATLQKAHREIFAYFEDIIHEKKDWEDDEVLGILLKLNVDGNKMDLGAVLANCYSLLLGANVTTPHVPSGALYTLMETGGYEDWATHPELIPVGVEEALRWSSPASHFMRYAIEDVEIRGKQIKKGDAVVAWIGSANRDEEVFKDPFKFDIRRKHNPHIAFGKGAHYCVGHPAARQTIKILFEELFDNFESFELAGKEEHLASNFIAGIKNLPVRGYVRKDKSISLNDPITSASK